MTCDAHQISLTFTCSLSVSFIQMLKASVLREYRMKSAADEKIRPRTGLHTGCDFAHLVRFQDPRAEQEADGYRSDDFGWLCAW